MRRAGRAVAALAIVAACGAGFPLGDRGDPRAAEATIVRVEPATTSPRTGATFTVAIKIRRAHHTGSVPFALVFDPRILEFVASGSVEGGFLSKDGSPTSFLAAPAPHAGGLQAVVVGLSRLRSDRGVGGKGTLCKLTFRARAPGVSPLAFSRASVLDPAATPVTAEFRGGSITVRPAP